MKKGYMQTIIRITKIFTLFILATNCTNHANAQWIILDSFRIDKPVNVFINSDEKKNIYMAISDNISEYKSSSKILKFDGNKLNELAGDKASTFTESIKQICNDAFGNVYVLLKSGNIYNWNGKEWNKLNTSYFRNNISPEKMKMKIGTDDKLYLFESTLDLDKYFQNCFIVNSTILKWDGNKWKEIKGTFERDDRLNDFTVNEVGDINVYEIKQSLTAKQVSYSNGVNDKGVRNEEIRHRYIGKWNGKKWSEVSNGTSSDFFDNDFEGCIYPRFETRFSYLNYENYDKILVKENGNIYYLRQIYNKQKHGFEYSVSKWDGIYWSKLGGVMFSKQDIEKEYKLVVNSNNDIYVWNNDSIKIWSNNNWTQVHKDKNNQLYNFFNKTLIEYKDIEDDKIISDETGNLYAYCFTYKHDKNDRIIEDKILLKKYIANPAIATESEKEKLRIVELNHQKEKEEELAILKKELEKKKKEEYEKEKFKAIQITLQKEKGLELPKTEKRTDNTNKDLSTQVNGVIFIKYKDNNGITHRYPTLKKDGDSFIPNSTETQTPTWNEYYPYYVNSNGELQDADHIGLGWYEGNDFYIKEGGEVSGGIEKVYKHKEMIYDFNETTFRFCNGQRAWLTNQNQKNSYLFSTENRNSNTPSRNEGRIYFELGNLKMNIQIMTAIFWRLKLINSDTSPCGFGIEDDRGELNK